MRFMRLYIQHGSLGKHSAMALALIALGTSAAPAQQVDTITDAENVPLQVQTAAPETQPLPEADAAARRWSGRFLRRLDPRSYVSGYRGASVPHVPANPQGAYLGVELDARYPRDAVVASVSPGTPAAEAGLKAGDRIWAINEQRVEDINDLIYQVGRMQPGQRVDISFDRPQTAAVVLGQRGQTSQATTSDTAHASDEAASPDRPRPPEKPQSPEKPQPQATGQAPSTGTTPPNGSTPSTTKPAAPPKQPAGSPTPQK